MRFRRPRAAKLTVDAVDAHGVIVRLDADGDTAESLSDVEPHGIVTVRGSQQSAPPDSSCGCPRVHVHEVLGRGDVEGRRMAVLAW